MISDALTLLASPLIADLLYLAVVPFYLFFVNDSGASFGEALRVKFGINLAFCAMTMLSVCAAAFLGNALFNIVRCVIGIYAFLVFGSVEIGVLRVAFAVIKSPGRIIDFVRSIPEGLSEFKEAVSESGQVILEITGGVVGAVRDTAVASSGAVTKRISLLRQMQRPSAEKPFPFWMPREHLDEVWTPSLDDAYTTYLEDIENGDIATASRNYRRAYSQAIYGTFRTLPAYFFKD
jgi:hypothetical protein